MMEQINLEQDAQGVQVDDSGVKRVSALAAESLTLQQQIEDLNNLMTELTDQKRKIDEYDLPDAMSQAGVTEFKLTNGAKVTVKPFYSGKITDENKDQAFSWLRDNDFADLIKHEIVVPLGRGNEEQAKEIMEMLKKMRAQYTDKESVHHSTLAAFIKEQVEAGSAFPMETFNAYVGRRAKIKL